MPLILALILGLSLGLPTPPMVAQQVFRPDDRPRQVKLADFWRDLSSSQVIYLGETHDSAADHQAQQDILQALHHRNRRLAIAMEMFQRPFQPVIDRYLAGEINEAQLRQQTEYDQRWGFPWEFYGPILRYARAHGLPVLALNTPAEVSRKVARQGLESLTPEDLQWIPPLSEIRPEPEAYRAKIREVFDSFHQGLGKSMNFDRFFLAQVLWDETMADTIARYLSANTNTQVLVLVGKGHVAYGYGIPGRVARRWTGQKPLRQILLLLNPTPDLKVQTDPPVADYFWVTSQNDPLPSSSAEPKVLPRVAM